jgi:uncharacterized protein (TIGR03435 family)
MRLTLSLCACLTLSSALAQPKLQFEVASVKASQQGESNRMIAMSRMLDMMPVGMIPMPDAGLVRIQNWSLRHLIAAAYRVREDKISGPPWMADVFFDIEAKLPSGAKKDEAHEMLQALLAERFGVELHRETRESAGFALIIGKNGPKMQESAPSPEPAQAATPEEAEEQRKERQKAMQDRARAQLQQMKNSPHKAGQSSSSWSSITMAEFAGHLTRLAGGPVIDETSLTAKYSVKIETWKATEDEPEETIFQAVEKLGLKLAPRKVSVETLVIDKVSRTPTEN